MGTDLKEALLANAIPTIAADIPSAAFAALSADTSWMTNGEAWKSVVGEYPALGHTGGGGGGGGSLREVVVRKKGEGCRWVLLFSVRDDRAFLVQL